MPDFQNFIRNLPSTMGENQTNPNLPEQSTVNSALEKADSSDTDSTESDSLESSSSVSSSPPNKALDLRNKLFWATLFGFAGIYLLLIVAMLVADFQFTSVADLSKLIADPYVQYSISLSLISSTIASIMAMWIAVPTGYWLARFDTNPRSSFPRRSMKKLIFALLDIPIVLPPIVVGISLLVLFQTPVGRQLDQAFVSLLTTNRVRGHLWNHLRNSRCHPCSIYRRHCICNSYHATLLRSDRPSSRTSRSNVRCHRLPDVCESGVSTKLRRNDRCLHVGLGSSDWRVWSRTYFCRYNSTQNRSASDNDLSKFSIGRS